MYLGDVPAPQLWKSVIDTRETLAAVRNSHGVPDTFLVPPGLNRTSDGPNGGNTGNVLAAAITANIMGISSADIHSVKRASMNAALTAMNNAINQLQSPTGQTTAIAPTIPVAATLSTNSPTVTVPNAPALPQVATAAPLTSPYALPATTSTAMPSNMWLYLLGGGAALLLLMKGKKGGKQSKAHAHAS